MGSTFDLKKLKSKLSFEEAEAVSCDWVEFADCDGVPGLAHTLMLGQGPVIAAITNTASPNLLERVVGNMHRVRTHVGDQPHQTFRTQLHAFIQFLRQDRKSVV